MKKLLIIICTAAVIMLHSMCGLTANADNSGNYTYIEVGGRVIVTGYTGSPEFLEIPSDINGSPVTDIGERAFSSCDTLKRIILPDTLRKIGNYSFYACYSLEIASLPQSLESLGEGSFCGCTRLSQVNIPENIRSLPDSCFRACTNLPEINLKNGISAIGDFCFSGCTNLSYVSFGDKLSEIGERAFYMCSSLENLSVPPSVVKVGKEAFGYIPSNFGAAVKGGFVIYGQLNSTANEYADNNGIRFSAAPESLRVLAIHDKTEKFSKIPEISVIGAMLFLVVSALSGRHRKRSPKRVN